MAERPSCVFPFVCVQPIGDKYSCCTCMMDGVGVLAISSVLQALSDRLLRGDPVTGDLELSQQLEKPVQSWNYDSRESSCSSGDKNITSPACTTDWNKAAFRGAWVKYLLLWLPWRRELERFTWFGGTVELSLFGNSRAAEPGTNEKSHGTVCLKAPTNQRWMVSFSCETIPQGLDGSTG